MDWAEKYRPQHLSDILGNAAAVKQMNEWARNWTNESRPLLLTGKPGIGKTSAALALARDYNWEVLELNASDARTKTIIERVAGNSAQTASLFGSDKKLIIIDEADNLEGNADRGGARAIADLLKDAKQPVILIANDAYGVSESIRRLCDAVLFRAITPQTLSKRMREICSIEKINCGEDALSAISESSAGDMRCAVNMLFGSAAGKENIHADDVNTSQKDERATIFDLVGGVYSAAPDARLQKLSRECEEKPDYIVQWIEESLPLITDRRRRTGSYRRISRADVYLGRTLFRQYYTLWRYATSLMTSGVAAENSGAGFRPRIMPPSRWKRMSTAKKQKVVRRALCASLAETYNIPEDQIQSSYIDLLSHFAKAEPVDFCERNNLDADSMEILLHDKVKAASVFKEVAKAAKERDIKVKKAAAAKKAEARKKQDLEEAIAAAKKVEEPAAAVVAEDKVEAEPSVEKKPAHTQATLDFF
ncbi:MAG: replication factor C large subunit [Methanocorpusculum sp.]|nr:replication factor C large subunit [Methanocorpusculum sp.]